jgi:hypothetical protein
MKCTFVKKLFSFWNCRGAEENAPPAPSKFKVAGRSKYLKISFFLNQNRKQYLTTCLAAMKLGPLVVTTRQATGNGNSKLAELPTEEMFKKDEKIAQILKVGRSKRLSTY